MTGLREHFAETAARAKYYDMTGVIHTARRRRRRRQAGAAAAAVLVAWVSVVIGFESAPGSMETVDATGEPTAGRLDWLPATFEVPDEPVPLPADRGVGEGALVYCRDMDCFLLASDGASYSVPGEIWGLSPDGRWLVYAAGDALMLRLLTGDRVEPLAAIDIRGWSATGATVVAMRSRAEVTVVDPDRGSVVTVAVPDPDWWQAKGLAADGDVMLAPRSSFTPAAPSTTAPPMLSTTAPAPAMTTGPAAAPPTGVDFGIAYVDPATGRTRGQPFRDIDGSDIDADWQPWAGFRVLAQPATGSVVFQPRRRVTTDETPFYTAGDLIEISPSTGAPLRRYTLPEPSSLDDPAGELVGVVPEGILLRWPANPPRIEVLDPSGARHTVSTGPAGVEIRMVRGGTAF